MAKKKNGIITPIIRSTAAEFPIPPRVRKYTGSPASPPKLKQISCLFVRLNANFVFTRARSFGTGT